MSADEEPRSESAKITASEYPSYTVLYTGLMYTRLAIKLSCVVKISCRFMSTSGFENIDHVIFHRKTTPNQFAGKCASLIRDKVNWGKLLLPQWPLPPPTIGSPCPNTINPSYINGDNPGEGNTIIIIIIIWTQSLPNVHRIICTSHNPTVNNNNAQDLYAIHF